MVKAKYGGKIMPREFTSVRSANICINKLVREIIRDMPATKTSRQKKTVSKEYIAGIRNKFSLVVEAVKLRKALHNEKSL
jgi:hypothetical protein